MFNAGRGNKGLPKGSHRKPKYIYADDYGAIGDGVTDDTDSIIEALAVASAKQKTLKFTSGKTYVVTEQIWLDNNTHIDGNGATIFMDSHVWSPGSTSVNLFYAELKDDISFENIVLESVNDEYYELVPDWRTGTSSNVQAIFLRGTTNINYSNVTIKNMLYGLNFGQKIGISCSNIEADNVVILNSREPIHMIDVSYFTMQNSLLDADVPINHRHHIVYLDGNTDHITFINTTFRKAAGSGLQCYNGYATRPDTSYVTLTDCTIEDTRSALLMWTGANHFTVTNLVIDGCQYAINTWGCNDIDIDGLTLVKMQPPKEGIYITEGVLDVTGDETALNFISADNFTITNATLNVGAGRLVNQIESCNVLTLSIFDVSHIQEDNAFYTSHSDNSNIKVKDSTFTWDEEEDVDDLNGVRNGIIFRHNTCTYHI